MSRHYLLFTLILCHCQSWEGFDKPASSKSDAATGTCTGPIASVMVTSGGTNFTTVPTITANGSGTGATFSALLTATSVASLTLTAGGSGFAGAVFGGSVIFTGGGGTGASASATASYQIISYTVNMPGSGYQNGGPYPVPVMGSGTLAQANITVTGGGISTATVFAAGSGYTGVPTVNLASVPPGTGVGGMVTANLGNGTITSLTLGSAGSGYTSPPTVTITGGGGTGATATANLTATSLASASVVSGGTGYGTDTTVSITGGGGSGATATVQISGCP